MTGMCRKNNNITIHSQNQLFYNEEWHIVDAVLLLLRLLPIWLGIVGFSSIVQTTFSTASIIQQMSLSSAFNNTKKSVSRINFPYFRIMLHYIDGVENYITCLCRSYLMSWTKVTNLKESSYSLFYNKKCLDV